MKEQHYNADAESGEEAAAQLEEAVDLLMSVVKELKSLKGGR